MKLKASYVMYVTFCSIKPMLMLIKIFWRVVLLFIIKKENQIGIYLFEYNVKPTVKMFENVKYTSEHRTEKVHSIEDDKENPFKREWRKC